MSILACDSLHADQKNIQFNFSLSPLMIHLSLPEDFSFPFLPYSPLLGSLFTKINPHRRPARDPCLGYPYQKPLPPGARLS
jgi:hypothetical protein